MKFLLLFFLLFSATVWGSGELVVVQTVSVDKKSFVISKGIKDGITVGQELIFANENVSIVCKAIEVNRSFSYWIPLNSNISIPFNRAEIISANSHIYGNVELDLVADNNKLIETLEKKLLADKASIGNLEEKLANRMRSHYSIRGSLGAGLTQSSSSVSSTQNSNRYAYDISLEYDMHLKPEIEIGFGARLDSDIYRISNPSLDIPTKRIMAIGIATYHFLDNSDNRNNYYISLVGGIGTSQTIVNKSTNTGFATILPQVRLGYLILYSKLTSMILEGSMESISAQEKLPDGSKQISNYANIKGSVGITF